MPRSDQLARVQLGVATATAVGAVLVVLRPALDAYSLPKAAWLVAGATVVTLLGGARLALRGAVAVPGRAPTAVAGALVAAGLYATVTSDVVTLSVVGRLGRYSGAAVYLAAVVLALVHARRAGPADVRRAAWAVLGAAAAVSLLAVAWRLGLDPTGLEARSLRQPATLLGNSNFTGAVAAFGVVLGAGSMLTGRTLTERALAGAGLVVCALGVAVSGALQAPFAVAGGLVVVAACFLGSREDALGRVGVPAVLGTAAVGGLLSVLGVAGIGPLSLLAEQPTFQLRLDSWKAAWRMFLAEPLTGVGLDRYAAYFREYRPVRSALTRTAEDFADAPHNVPLGMFASGGLVLGVVYLAAVVAVVVVAVRAYRRADAAGRRLLGLVGGAWVAYHVQSLVSVDVPPLVALHGLFAGMLLAAAGGLGFRDRQLPWAALEPQPSRRGRPARELRGGSGGRRPTRGPRSRPGTAVATAVTAVVGAVVGTVVLVWLSRPVRADVASFDAQVALDQDRPTDAVPHAERAQALAPWRPEYHVQEGRAHVAVERWEPALEALTRALARDPRDMDALVTAARVADRLDRDELSVELYRRMLAVERQAPELVREAAGALFRAGEVEQATQLLERATVLTPDDATVWRDLGRAYVELGRDDRALTAWRRALQLDPDPELERAIAELADGAGDR